jgi:hypothetical protein
VAEHHRVVVHVGDPGGAGPGGGIVEAGESGNPVPTSMNWRTPWPATYATARPSGSPAAARSRAMTARPGARQAASPARVRTCGLTRVGPPRRSPAPISTTG